ncbi:hypothetical protein [Elioraea tepidiphila]|uniref:hypothetical protein n=1 Tax=Elioraea tepidiphila TaxID=457934 RepID=UPI00036DC3D4|nr:hypothetical protein [Elioraea tepidiphila]
MDGAEESGAELDALARDWITLWQSELTALASDPEAVEAWTRLLSLWAGAAAAGLRMAPRTDAVHDPYAARPAPPPRTAAAGAASDAGGVAGDGGRRDDAVLARILDRLDAIERRIAALEVGRGRGAGRGAGRAPGRSRARAG